LRAAVEDVLSGTTKHTTRKANRVPALEVSKRVHRELSRSIRGSPLIMSHGLLGRGPEGVSEAGNIVRLVQKNGRGGSRGRRNGSNQDRSSKSSSRTVL
jgi:hypothetical protein